jgi:hypothetical protein
VIVLMDNDTDLNILWLAKNIMRTKHIYFECVTMIVSLTPLHR